MLEAPGGVAHIHVDPLAGALDVLFFLDRMIHAKRLATTVALETADSTGRGALGSWGWRIVVLGGDLYLCPGWKCVSQVGQVSGCT